MPMDKDKFRKVVKEILIAMSSDPPVKSKSVEEIVTQTGLQQTEVEAVISGLKRQWKVSKITAPVQ